MVSKKRPGRPGPGGKWYQIGGCMGDNMPERIQRKRSKGWKMPPNTVYVGRGSKFGNPFKITEDRDAREVVSAFEIWLTVDGVHAGIPEKKVAILDNIEKLKGKNLACWCKIGAPCHADVLLKLVNK